MIIEPMGRYRAAPIILASAIIMMACGRSPMVRFYTLSPTQLVDRGAGSELALAIGPSEFPRSLDRSQIVTRASDTQLKVDEYNIWSAPLDFEFLRVLGDNIATELGSDRVVVYPAEPPFTIDYRILLDVLQFEGVLGQDVNLRVRWTIMRTGDAVAFGTFENRQPIAANDQSYDALVTAHSAAIGELSQAITAELNRLGKPASD